MCCCAGCLSVTVFSLLFGLSSSLEMAIGARLVMGLTNPLAGLVKTLVSEICGPGEGGQGRTGRAAGQGCLRVCLCL